uniref:SAM domain-containing protein n=1 Tax=Caenorhabditis tropicalis TaxID=1561998 RepID=A0A1I7TSJ8_9PELO
MHLHSVSYQVTLSYKPMNICTLTEKEQHLVKKVIKIALQEKSAKIQLPHELKWPENIPMIVDHWIKDKHSFKLDGLVLLGLCKVVGENVRVILKLADEVIQANDRLKKPAVQPQDELFITVPDLVEVDVPLMIQRGLRFTAEISKITIPDAPPSDVWKDEVIWNLDEDLSPITDEMLKEMNEITSTYKISSENSASADFQESVFMFDDEDFPFSTISSCSAVACIFWARIRDATEERLPSLVLRFGKNGITSAASTPTLTSSEESQKRKYEKSIRSIPRSTTPPPTVVARSQEKEREKEEAKREKERKVALKRKMAEEEEEEEEEEVEEKPKPVLSKLKDWKSLIPSMDELRIRAEQAEKETKKVVEATTIKTKKDPTKVQLVKNFRRPILILPYLENPTGPDFLLHKYPNKLQYYSEDNFRFGEKRPSA